MGGGGLTDLSVRYEVMLLLKIFKTEFPSLLIRFIMTTDGKYKNLRLVKWIFCDVHLKMFCCACNCLS